MAARWSTVVWTICLLIFHSSGVTGRDKELTKAIFDETLGSDDIFIHHDVFFVTSLSMLKSNTSVFIDFAYDREISQIKRELHLEVAGHQVDKSVNFTDIFNSKLFIKYGGHSKNDTDSLSYFRNDVPLQQNYDNTSTQSKKLSEKTSERKQLRVVKYGEKREMPSKLNTTNAKTTSAYGTRGTEALFNAVQTANSNTSSFQVTNRSEKQPTSKQKLQPLRFVESVGSNAIRGDVAMATASRGHVRRKRTPRKRCWMDCTYAWKHGVIKCGYYDKLSICGGRDYMVRYWHVTKTYYAHCWPGKGKYGITKNRKHIWVYKCEGIFAVKYKKYKGCKPVCY